jgi:hypothetical protein
MGAINRKICREELGKGKAIYRQTQIRLAQLLRSFQPFVSASC